MTLTFKLSLNVPVPDRWPVEDAIGRAREMMLEDGLAEYINEDTLTNTFQP